MCEVFLLRDLGPFEIEVRGSLEGELGASVLSMVIEHLPAGSDAIIDLREGDQLDADSARHLVELVEDRAGDGVTFAMICNDPWAIRLLVAAGLSQAAIAADSRSAHHALAIHDMERVAS